MACMELKSELLGLEFGLFSSVKRIYFCFVFKMKRNVINGGIHAHLVLLTISPTDKRTLYRYEREPL